MLRSMSDFYSGGSSSSDADCDLCKPARPPTPLGTAASLAFFAATFVLVAAVAARRVFPRLSHAQRDDLRDGEDHVLPPSAPAALQQAHAAHGRARNLRRRIAQTTFAATLGLAAVLAELILAEVSGSGPGRRTGSPGGSIAPARDATLHITVPTLLFLLIGLIPFLEWQSALVGWGFSFQRTAKGRLPRTAWMLQLLGFGAWLFAFWSLGRLVPRWDHHFISAHSGGEDGSFFDASAASFETRTLIDGEDDSKAGGIIDSGFLGELMGRGLIRACLERIGVIGIASMALLSGFASVSSPWHAIADTRAYRRRPVTEADIARKQAGLDAASELLATKRHRLRSLQRKMAAAAESASLNGANGHGAHHAGSKGSGFMGKVVGTLKGIGGGGSADAVEVKALQLEISGLETMEGGLLSALSALRARREGQARAATAVGKLLAVPGWLFSIYCVYRVLATSLTSARRLFHPAAAGFSSSDPINRLLAVLAKHWDPKLDQISWARQISFLLSGVILAASAGSVLQTFQLLGKWAPGVVAQARANLALLVGQVAATYVIAASLLLRSSLPREVGSAVGGALEGALDPAFVDRWFEGWFLAASAATAAGIWVGGKISGGGPAGMAMPDYYYDDDVDGFGSSYGWDEYGGEEMGAQKRS